jgi:hypothetical protein
MSSKIAIEVVTLKGEKHTFEQVDVGMKIGDLIKHIASTHKHFVDNLGFSPDRVDWKHSRLLYKGISLDHTKCLEEYPEFQIKSHKPYKMHIIFKGGYDNSCDLDEEDVETHRTTATSPVLIRNSSQTAIDIPRMGHISDDFVDPSPPNAMVSRSFPGTTNAMDIHYMRRKHEEMRKAQEERRKRSEVVTQMSESLGAMSRFLKDISTNEPQDQNHNQMDAILGMLTQIDSKLDRLITLSSTPPQTELSLSNMLQSEE